MRCWMNTEVWELHHTRSTRSLQSRPGRWFNGRLFRAFLQTSQSIKHRSSTACVLIEGPRNCSQVNSRIQLTMKFRSSLSTHSPALFPVAYKYQNVYQYFERVTVQTKCCLIQDDRHVIVKPEPFTKLCKYIRWDIGTRQSRWCCHKQSCKIRSGPNIPTETLRQGVAFARGARDKEEIEKDSPDKQNRTFCGIISSDYFNPRTKSARLLI